jgi:aldoxime dehydratase
LLQSLEHMERWAESHPTHLHIFGSFMKMVRAMNFDLKLPLYHEVAVVPAHDQTFEYINCHTGTGLLRCAKVG